MIRSSTGNARCGAATRKSCGEAESSSDATQLERGMGNGASAGIAAATTAASAEKLKSAMDGLDADARHKLQMALGAGPAVPASSNHVSDKMPSLGEVRAKCRETWGKDWHEVADDEKEARKCVATAALGGPPADDASIALAGDMAAARAATESAAEQAAHEAKRQAERVAARDEAEAREEEQEAAEALVNQQAWEDFLGKTWGWSAARKRDAAWKTIELQRDGRCIICEGSGDKTESQEKLMWQVLGNTGHSKKRKGALALVGHRGGKPIECFSREAFAEEYPAEMDASLRG